MKRFISLSILLLYLVSVTGVALSFHWCGGKLNSVKIVYAEKHSCTCGTKPMKKGCCKNEVSYCKIKAEHSPKSTSNIAQPDFQKLFFRSLSILNLEDAFSKSSGNSQVLHPPPYLQREPVFLLNRTLLI